MERKHHAQLGSKSAAYRLTKDLLFKFILEGGHRCFRCGGELTRDTFSIDHKVPWLDNDRAIELFFDLDNIAFSHRLCNYKAARKPHKRFNNKKERDAAYHREIRAGPRYNEYRRNIRSKKKLSDTTPI